MARKTKKELETARELAFILYLNQKSNLEISERVGVSQATITAWVKENGWKEKRAAKTITRTELINKTLEQIGNLLENADDKMSVQDADKLVKLSALIERLDKKNSPVTAMEVFIAFTGFLQNTMNSDRNLSVEFIKQLNKYQDYYITTLMNG